MTETREETHADPLGAIARELHQLGAESHSERAAKRAVPWAFSLALHGGIFVLALLVAGTARLIREQSQAPLIVADFDSLTYAPLSEASLVESELDQEIVQDRVQVETIEPVVQDRMSELAIDPITFISTAASESSAASFAPRPVEGGATFVGVKTTNARRVVYVIDASGSLLGTLQVVVQELSRSLEALTGEQEFSIIFFQQDRALTVPPGKLVPAIDREKVRAMAWVDDTIIPSGSSNPLPALEAALALEPDVIFLLSDNITGAGQYEVDRADLLAMLERLNPRERSGRRRTQINCVQFLDPDPLDTLAAIAAEHGGPGGYKFLDRRELGLAR